MTRALAVLGAAALMLLAGGPAHSDAAPPKLNARAWILIDSLDGTRLAAGAPHRRLPIASATKLMTAYLSLRELRPNQTLRAPAYRALEAESLLGLRAGERIKVRDLLYALLLASANDAALALAEGVGGSERAFVARMNRAAKSLGLKNTHYTNPTGLDDRANFSSANDLVELADRLLDDPLFARIVDTRAKAVGIGPRRRRITTRNTLLTRDSTITGVKTGHTVDAGYVLIGSARRGGTTLISAVLGARSEAARDRETERLLGYGFSRYRRSMPVRRGDPLASTGLDHREERLSLTAARTVEVSARKGQRVGTEIEIPGEVRGDVEIGQQIGRVVVTVDGRPAAASALVAARSVEASTFLGRAGALLLGPIGLIPLGLVAIAVAFLVRRRRRGMGEGPAQSPDPGPQQRSSEERRTMHDQRMRRRDHRQERSRKESG